MIWRCDLVPQYKNYKEEYCIINSISHETIHQVLSKFINLDTSCKLDNVDNIIYNNRKYGDPFCRISWPSFNLYEGEKYSDIFKKQKGKKIYFALKDYFDKQKKGVKK